MRLFRPLFFQRWLFNEALFRINTEEKILLLTIDDGPDLHSTPRLLDILDKNNVKAIFFCTGRKAERHPSLIDEMRSRGHVIGNHGYCHYDGWKVRNEEYIADVRRSAPFTSKVLFRPPYGRLRQEQYNWLKREYKVVFWDLMPYDFDAGFGPVRAVKVLKRKIRPGSIIVLHDNPSYPSGDIAEDLIAIAAEKGYSFDNCEVTGCN